MLLDTAKSLVECHVAPEQAQRGNVDSADDAIEPVGEHVAQLANPIAIQRFRESGLRIEAGDERVEANDVRNIASGDADGAIRPSISESENSDHTVSVFSRSVSYVSAKNSNMATA